MNILFVGSMKPPPPCLTTAIACARHFNPKSTVIQIGNTPCGEDKFFDDSEFQPLCDQILNGAQFGPGPQYWERACITRWIYTAELIKRGEIKLPLLCCDWDVLVVRDIEEVLPLWSEYDYTLGRKIDASQMLVFNPEVLPAYVEFLKECYVWETYPGVKKTSPAVNDMGLFHHFRGYRPGFYVGETDEIRGDSLFDSHVNLDADKYLFEDGHKKLFFDKRGAWIKRVWHEKFIQVNTIHCCTRKDRMDEWFRKARES